MTPTNMDHTTQDRTPVNTTPLSAVSDTDSEHALGHQLCASCAPYNTPCSTPDSVCECHSFPRRTAGHETVTEQADALLRTAETALLTTWSCTNTRRTGTPQITITDSLLEGRINDWHIARITFDGMLADDLFTACTTAHGIARVYAFSGTGALRVKVRQPNPDTEHDTYRN